jgi:dTDP-4-dehydrorhamnose 3,5-epimerase
MEGFLHMTKLVPGLRLFSLREFRDSRGSFFELFRAERDEIRDLQFVQDNVSSSESGVLRGLHFQKNPHAQGKLVTVLRGNIWDVAVDLRQGSATWGQWSAVELSSENRHILYIPPGFAHGFLVLSRDAMVHYKCTAYYNAPSESGVIWNDATLKVEWPLKNGQQPLLSDKDQKWGSARGVEL